MHSRTSGSFQASRVAVEILRCFSTYSLPILLGIFSFPNEVHKCVQRPTHLDILQGEKEMMIDWELTQGKQGWMITIFVLAGH